jgi:lauroyl/myristoyl acyltransferase
LPFWLRAAGLPVTAFFGRKSNAGPGPAWFEDRVSPCRKIPTVFYQDQLREVIKSLAAGNCLLMAIDSGAGHRVDVPVGNGWSFPMATGAIRLACRHRAKLIPCCIIDEGRWRFRIELGRAAPTPYEAENADLTRAGQHLLDEMLIHFRSYPSQCSSGLVRGFQPHRDRPVAMIGCLDYGLSARRLTTP